LKELSKMGLRATGRGPSSIHVERRETRGRLKYETSAKLGAREK